MRFLFLLLTAWLFILGCNDDNTKEVHIKPLTADTTNKTSLVRTGIDAEPKLLSADSIQIIYYDDPDGDTLRYARFFSYFNTNDTAILNELHKTLASSVSILQEARKCRSQGKMYLLKGEDPVKTVYFSTKDGECSYLYFIKDGLFYYFQLPEATKTMLKKQKAKAIRD